VAANLVHRRRTDGVDNRHRQVMAGGPRDSGSKAHRLSHHYGAEVTRRRENHHAAGDLVASQLPQRGPEYQPAVAHRQRTFGGRHRDLRSGPKRRGDGVVGDCVGAQRNREPEARADDTSADQADADRPHPWPPESGTP
jgi:hypothetical protein